MKQKQKPVEFDHRTLIQDRDTIDAFGGFCFVCKEPAVGVMIAIVDQERFQNPEWDDPRRMAIAEDLRERFGTNIEVPVCEVHVNQGLPF